MQPIHIKELLKIPSSLNSAYIALTLYGIGMSLVGIFIPIYLMEQGFTLNQALIHILITKIITLLLSPIVYKTDQKIGLQGTSLIRIPFFLTSFITLININPINYYVSAITAGFALAFFWIPIQTFFLHQTHKKKEGSEVGKFLSIPTFFKILSPAIGGIIIATIGFNSLFFIGLIIITLSTLPLFLTNIDKPKLSKLNLKNPKKTLGKQFFELSIADGFVYVAAIVLFPILLYEILQSFESIGYISSLGSFFFAISSLIIGKALDNKTKNHYYKTGAIIFSITLMLRPLITTELGFFLIIMIGAISASLYETSYITQFFKNAKQSNNPENYIILREMIANATRATVLFVLLFIPYKIGFLLAGLMLIIIALRN